MASRFGLHLTPGQLVDAADGIEDASVNQHLAVCDGCRNRLSDLQAMMSSVADADDVVPEPSPLFWDHFRQRVVEAAQAEREHEGFFARASRILPPAFVVPAAAALIVATAVVVTQRWGAGEPPSGARQTASVAPQDAAATGQAEVLRDSMDDDPSLQLIADLTVDMDWSATDAAGLAPNGSADHAVSHLDAQALKELQRLLRAELGT